MRSQLAAMTLAVLIGLAGCGPLVESDVTRFHTFTSIPTNATFRVVPSAHQKASMEWTSYAMKIETHLASHGFLKSRGDDFRYAVMFDYAVGDRETIVSSVPVFAETGGGGTTYHSGRIYGNSYGQSMRYSGTSYKAPSYGIVDFEPRSETNYTRKLMLDIVDKYQSSNPDTYKIFEGTVISKGEGRVFSEVADCLINSLFEGFPGESGQTESYVFFVSECGDEE